VHARIVARGLAAYPRVEIRLVAFLWELAETCGVAVADERVVVPVPLTHRVLATIIGCDSSSVTAALGVLRRDGLVIRTRSGWMSGPRATRFSHELDRVAPPLRRWLPASHNARGGCGHR
jgi:hypothetical protein